MHRLCDKKTYYYHNEVFWQTVGIQISQLLKKLADQDPRCLPCSYGLVDMVVICFHMLKIPSDDNFYLLF